MMYWHNVRLFWRGRSPAGRCGSCPAGRGLWTPLGVRPDAVDEASDVLQPRSPGPRGNNLHDSFAP